MDIFFPILAIVWSIGIIIMGGFFVIITIYIIVCDEDDIMDGNNEKNSSEVFRKHRKYDVILERARCIGITLFAFLLGIILWSLVFVIIKTGCLWLIS